MENKNIKEFILPIALMTGLARVIIDFIPKMLDASPAIYYSTFLICFIAEVVLLTIVTKRFKKLNDNYLTTRQAITIGVTAMVVIGTLYGLSSYIYDNFIDEFYQTNTMIRWGQMWGPEAEQAINQQIKENPPVTNITAIFITIVRFSILGLIISTIIGAVLKTKKLE